MYLYMEQNKADVMTTSNDAGIKRVFENTDYAFLMESKSIEYETERKCNLAQVGDPLDDKNYIIGMQKNFKFHSQLSEGVLQLQDKGVLTTLYKKWWKEQKGGGACSKTEDSDAEELKFENLKGVFLVLLYGTIFACLYGCCEICFCIYKKAKSEKIPFKEEFIAEFKCLLKCKGVKKVRHRKNCKSNTSHRGSNSSNRF